MDKAKIVIALLIADIAIGGIFGAFFAEGGRIVIQPYSQTMTRTIFVTTTEIVPVVHENITSLPQGNGVALFIDSVPQLRLVYPVMGFPPESYLTSVDFIASNGTLLLTMNVCSNGYQCDESTQFSTYGIPIGFSALKGPVHIGDNLTIWFNAVSGNAIVTTQFINVPIVACNPIMWSC